MKQTVLLLFITIAIFTFGKVIRPKEKSVFKKPSNFPEPVYNFKKNPVTKEGIELGRYLFYDVRLSRNNTISCGFCHIPDAAFSHHGHEVSHGIDNFITKRNAQPIINLAWSPVFMWDGIVSNLDKQPVIPITSHVEMDCTMDTIIERLKTDADYTLMFKKAFGSASITEDRILKALSQFMLMCISADSKYDKVMRNEGETFTADEEAGYEIFKKDCNSCHKEPLFTDYSFRNNGYGYVSSKDKGRFEVTKDSADMYKFKVPTLRNLAYTKPYMHNGLLYRFTSIIPQYRFYVHDFPNIDSLLKRNGKLGFTMTDKEAEQLLSFLQTLNDSSFVKNPALAEPDIFFKAKVF